MRKSLFILMLAFVFVPAIFGQNSKKRASVKELLVSYEKLMWEMYKNKDSKSLELMVADDFYDVYSSGRIVRRKEWFADMLATDILDFSLAGFDVIMLEKSAAIITYKAESHGRQNGKTGFNRAWVTSAWAKRGGKWRNVFYRESNILEAAKK